MRRSHAEHRNEKGKEDGCDAELSFGSILVERSVKQMCDFPRSIHRIIGLLPVSIRIEGLLP